MKNIASAIKSIASAVKDTGQYRPLLEISSRFFPGVGARIAVEGIAASFVSGCGSPGS
jgi:hypothetical protein